MTLVLTLPPDLERELAEDAARLGLPLDQYALQVLSSNRYSAPRNGAELVGYWQNAGLIGTRPEIPDAAAHARQLRDRAEHRVRP